MDEGEYPSEDYTIVVADKSQLPAILQFLRDNFHREETMMKSLRVNACVTEEEEKLIEEDEDNVVEAVFRSAPCLLAIHRASKAIVGANLMILTTRPQNEEEPSGSAGLFRSSSPKSKLANEYLGYLSRMDDAANIYGRFPNAKAILEFYAIAVDKNHRKLGLAKGLSTVGIALARKMSEVSVVFGVYTSLYSKRVAEKTGMRGILDMDLSTFENGNGQPVFRDTEPHNIVSVMVLEI